jgi:LPS export ABC transporter protein LptC
MIRQSFIGIILVVIISWFLVVWDSPPESFIRKNNSQVVQEPSVDSYMTAMTSQRFSDNGNELFILTSYKMELLSGETQLHLSAPRFVSRIGNLEQGEEKGVSFVANSGTLSADGSKLDLNGDVVAFINGISQQSTLTSNDLSYNSTRMTVTTSGNFKLVSPELTLSGAGLNANLDKEIFRINSKVRAIHDAI